MRKSTAALCSGLFLAALLPFSGSAAAAASPVTTVTSSGCVGSSGVTVVVDFSDVGGGVEIGCATGDPATGREALVGAGFDVTDSTPGMICAINSAPDPCPATFDGSYWSYWSAEPGATWSAYAVGADSSDPAPGAFEGWRYNDGTTGPSLLPAAIQAASTAAGTTAPSPAATVGTAAPGPALAADDGTSWIPRAAISVVAVLLVGGAAQVARRRREGGAGDPGADGGPQS
jgi:hypothetical protein